MFSTCRPVAICLATVLCVTCRVASQQPGPLSTAPAPSARFPAAWYPPTDQFSTTVGPVQGRPYVATLVTKGRYRNPKTGEVLTRTTKVLQARDSMGRRREEMEQPRPGADGKAVTTRLVSVTDPVSHCQFQWGEPWVPGSGGSTKPVASVTCQARTARLQDGDLYASFATAEEDETRQFNTTYKNERLPGTIINGIQVVGKRNTNTTTKPDGTTARLVAEWWYSPEMAELIAVRQIEPADMTVIPEMELADLRREEPDGKLFYPPAGYEILSNRPPPNLSHTH